MNAGLLQKAALGVGLLGLALFLAGCDTPGHLCYAYPEPESEDAIPAYSLCCVENKCEVSGPDQSGNECDDCGNDICQRFWQENAGVCTSRSDWGEGGCMRQEHEWQRNREGYFGRLEACGEKHHSGSRNTGCDHDPSAGPESTGVILTIVLVVLSLIPTALSCIPCCCNSCPKAKNALLCTCLVVAWLLLIVSFIFPALQSCEAWIDDWCGCYKCAPKMVDLLMYKCQNFDDHSADFGRLYMALWIWLVLPWPITVTINAILGWSGVVCCQESKTQVTAASGAPGVVIGQPVVQQAVLRNLEVVVPEGVAAGQNLLVTTPEGNQVQVAVPQGAFPGSKFTIQY